MTCDRERQIQFGRRLARLVSDAPRYEPHMLMSRASKIARSWRTSFAWHLANALGAAHSRHCKSLDGFGCSCDPIPLSPRAEAPT